MPTDQNDPNEEPISLELELDSEPQPVPVPPPGSTGPSPVPVPPPGGPQPVPVPPPARKLVEEPESISLVDNGDADAPTKSVSKRITGAAARGLTHKQEFKRELNLSGKGATRCRIFNAKIAEGPMLHMEGTINEWLDDEEIEVKHVGHVIGVLEGKRSEPNLIVMVWY